MNPEVNMNKSEEDFLNEYVRSMLPTWGDVCLRLGDMSSLTIEPLHLQEALRTGWVTQKEPRRLTAKGFASAASYLRR